MSDARDLSNLPNFVWRPEMQECGVASDLACVSDSL